LISTKINNSSRLLQTLLLVLNLALELDGLNSQTADTGAITSMSMESQTTQQVMANQAPSTFH
jgi:hypothetical protein